MRRAVRILILALAACAPSTLPANAAAQGPTPEQERQELKRVIELRILAQGFDQRDPEGVFHYRVLRVKSGQSVRASCHWEPVPARLGWRRRRASLRA